MAPVVRIACGAAQDSEPDAQVRFERLGFKVHSPEVVVWLAFFLFPNTYSDVSGLDPPPPPL